MRLAWVILYTALSNAHTITSDHIGLQSDSCSYFVLVVFVKLQNVSKHELWYSKLTATISSVLIYSFGNNSDISGDRCDFVNESNLDLSANYNWDSPSLLFISHHFNCTIWISRSLSPCSSPTISKQLKLL